MLEKNLRSVQEKIENACEKKRKMSGRCHADSGK